MLVLSLCWLLLGALIGVLANGAKLRPGAPRRTASHHPRQGWLLMLAIGALAALLGGWLGTLLLGKYIATAVALWVAVLAVVVCRLVPWARTRFGPD
jgi:uncharacterized membrane protein YeaQ/YmgE (transglycosylase-associated protein family)